MELSEKLRKIRKQHKKTQKDVADFLGITESGYGYYEQGRNKPSIETLEKLSELYNVPFDYWKSGEVKESSSGYFAFRDGGDSWTEEEIEVARAAVEAFRKMRKNKKS